MYRWAQRGRWTIVWTPSIKHSGTLFVQQQGHTWVNPGSLYAFTLAWDKTLLTFLVKKINKINYSVWTPLSLKLLGNNVTVQVYIKETKSCSVTLFCASSSSLIWSIIDIYSLISLLFWFWKSKSISHLKVKGQKEVDHISQRIGMGSVRPSCWSHSLLESKQRQLFKIIESRFKLLCTIISTNFPKMFLSLQEIQDLIKRQVFLT